MNINKKGIFGGFVVTAAIVAVGFYVYQDLYGFRQQAKTEKDAVTASTTETVGISIQTDKPGDNAGYTVNVLEDRPETTSKIGPKMPELDAPVVDYKRLSPEMYKIVTENIKVLTEDLKKTPENENNWLQLAIFRKTLGDYGGAIQILNYLSLAWPKDYVVYNNLADIYQFYSKNYPLAEKN